VLLASELQTWKNALVIVQPETILHDAAARHRELFRRVRKRRSRSWGKPGKPPLPDGGVALLRRLTKENRGWGAERIRGELLKLGIRIK
jgi:hypothetical protein